MDDSSEKEKKEESSSSGITDLPIHILMEILFRLPIKTLVASKSVCKSWLHLINDPVFAKLHQPRAKVEICFQRYNGTYIPKLRMGNFYYTQTSHSLDLNLNTVLELPPFGGNLITCFVNSCNGLLCYSCGKFALIWNPITSELLTVPSPSSSRYRSGVSSTYGLGFSQKTNRFKLLFIHIQNTPEIIIETEICTVKKQGCSWRTIESCPYTIWDWDTFGQSHFFRGALHWFANKYCHMNLISFDFDDEKFARVPLPPHFDTIHDFNNIAHTNISQDFNKIGVLKDCLFVTGTTDGNFNIWLMKDYGDGDSWTRVIYSEFGPDYQWYNWECMPLHYLDNGEILMMRVQHPTYLFMYCPDSKKGPSPITFNVDQMDRAITFNPSLVLLEDFIMA